jgi:hypothetical protein
MCKVINIKDKGDESNFVYIGRPTKFGNPYSHREGTLAEFRVASRKEALEKYEKYLLSNPSLMESLHELKGKTLVCWCKPKACHGDILKKYVDKLEKGLPATLF